MKTATLEYVNKVEPVIEKMETVANTILSYMDSDFSEYETFEFDCPNGLHIEVEAFYSGFSYRTITLKHVYVMDENKKCFKDYEDELRGYLIDGISDLNYESEERFYNITEMFD